MSYMPTTRMFLKGFGLYPNKSITKVGVSDTLRIIVTSLPLWFVALTSYAYLKANLKTADIAVITDAMYTNFIFTMMCCNYVLLTIRKFQVRKVIDDIGRVVADRRLNKCSTATIYDSANERSENFIKKYTFWCFVGNMGVNFFPFLKPLYHYLTGKYSFSSWYTPYKSYMWHNVTYTPSGMATTLVGQELGCVCAILLSSTYLSLYVSSCVYISAMLEDVAKTVKKLDELPIGLPKTHTKMKIQFIDMLELHVKAISIRNEVASLVSAYLFVSICNCVGALCTLLFQLQVSASNLSIEVYQAIGIGSLMVLFLFLFCYFGELVTDRSLKIAITAYCDTLWYKYPMKTQRYIQMSIRYSLTEFHFSGLGLMYMTMASFSGLVKTSLSFFMLFRSVA